ncbi:HalOD1 output domain-containing protein [Haladaptatus sp. NG-SE-30]
MTDNNPADASDRPGDDLADKSHQLEIDPVTDPISEEIVEAVATLDGTEPQELAILADYVNPDSLDALFRPLMDGTPRDTNGHVRFVYDEYHVSVASDGTITISQQPTAND